MALTGQDFALDPGAETMGTSRVTAADRARLEQLRSKATWTLACLARNRADFFALCDVAGLDTSRRALALVWAQHAPSLDRPWDWDGGPQ